MRTLTITAAEVPAVQTALATDGTLWLVAPAMKRLDATSGKFEWLPPVEFVQACAPCKNPTHRLDHRTGLPIARNPSELGPGMHVNSYSCVPCPDCRIELVGPCWTHDADLSATAHAHCTTLGYAYAVGEPMPIYGDDGATGEHLYASAILGAVYLHAGLHLHTGLDITDRLAHAGPPESLVGKLALKLEVVGS